MSITHNREFKGIWIPAEIWLADELNALEKILLVEVNSLDNERGCIAGNDYFAGFLGVTTIRVSQMIKKLKDEKYIYEASFDGRTRTLKSNIKTIIKQSKDDYKPALKEIIKQNEENYKPALKEIINNSNTVNNLSNNPFNKINTASGLSQNENPTVKDSLQVQNQTRDKLSRIEKPKKEDDFEQAWLFWKDLCKNKGSQTGEKKPAKIQYEKVLKKVKQDDIMRVLKAFNDYIQIAFENNKNFERWIKSANWDNIDEAVADYKQQESNRKKELIKDGKPLPLPQKTTMEAEKEVIDTNALIELRNAKYNALTQDRQKASDEIRDYLLTYFSTIHHEWINSSLWHQQALGNNEVDLRIGIFLESKRRAIELNADKIRDKLRFLKGNTIKQIIIKVIGMS